MNKIFFHGLKNSTPIIQEDGSGAALVIHGWDPEGIFVHNTWSLIRNGKQHMVAG
jgi:hypothetical protein